MEFLKLVRRRSFLSEVIYVVLNIAFAVAIALVLRSTESLLAAFALVAISKWRVLAVRSRYWLANIQANLVDVIVSVSVVLSLYAVQLASMTDFKKWILFGLLTLLYIAWLLIVKPRSTRRAMVLQAAVALFAGTAVLYSVSYNWVATAVVLVMWVIGFATARHVLSAYDEDRLLPLSLMWAVVMAEIGWVAYHWTVGYTVPGATDLFIPQVAIIVLLVGFIALKIYDSFFHYQKIRSQDVVLPILFSVSVIAVLLTVFGGLGTVI
jgi:hypothetical protein